MGSNCCRHKDQSPKVSLRKIFSRWTHRISPKSETVKIADAEEDGYINKWQDRVVTDPIFDTPESEDRNHVTMLLPDAPRNPPRKKTRLSNKRVSFQSDVEIMRTASSKSLDRFTVTVVEEEPKARSKSFDSYFDATATTISPVAQYLKKRRTSSLEHLTPEDVQHAPSLVAKLRRDTLGDALDFNSYKRPLVLPKPEEPLIEEESDVRSSEEEEDEEVVTSFKLASKLRRDTLGDALQLTRSHHKDDTPTGSSTEDLEETLKHSRLCSKLRRDTFGDALRQAVHCKACSSMEDITELEVPFPATPEEDEKLLTEQVLEENKAEAVSSSVSEGKSNVKIVRSESKCQTCKTCMSLELESEETDQCAVCSSNENIPDTDESTESTRRRENKEKSPQRQSLENLTSRKLTLTDEEISQTLEKIRTTGKIEPREPYNLVYSSCIKGPFASSRENINKGDSKSSSQDSLEVKIMNKSDILNTPDSNRNHLIA